MKVLNRLVVPSLVLVFIAATNISASASQLPSIYWGAILYGRAPDSYQFQPGGQFYNFETNIAKKKMSIVSWGAPWEYPQGTMLRFQTSYFNNVRADGSIPLLNWGSWSSCCGPNQPLYKLSNITRGDFDAFITQWATDAKAWGHPFFLRFDHEMNGNWQFPWSAQLNGNTATDYINAWRHVHAIFDRVGANNVTWVWCPNISGPNTLSMAQLYPGDAYVDWIGLDGYNFYNQGNMPWFSFAQVYSGDTKVVSNSKDSYTEITQLAQSKPLMIAEFSSIEAGDGGLKKAAWIQEALVTDIPLKYPRIKAIVWFNWNVSSNLTWVVESSAKSQAAFAQAINTVWYAPNDFSGLGVGKIQPLAFQPTQPTPTVTASKTTLPTQNSTVTKATASATSTHVTASPTIVATKSATPKPSNTPTVRPTLTNTPTQQPTQITAQIIDITSSLVQKQGSWALQTASTGFLNHYMVSSGSVNDTLTVTFEGTSITLYYVKSPSFGIYTITLDGVLFTTQNGSASKIVFGSQVPIRKLALGTHTLQVKPVSGAIGVEAFVIGS